MAILYQTLDDLKKNKGISVPCIDHNILYYVKHNSFAYTLKNSMNNCKLAVFTGTSYGTTAVDVLEQIAKVITNKQLILVTFATENEAVRQCRKRLNIFKELKIPIGYGGADQIWLLINVAKNNEYVKRLAKATEKVVPVETEIPTLDQFKQVLEQYKYTGNAYNALFKSDKWKQMETKKD